MPVEIVEILRRSEQGMTRPFICRCNDGKLYFVKGKDAGRRSQICEWVAGRLAVLMGLPVAPFQHVLVPEDLAEFNAGTSLDGLGAGLAFGSLERQVTELTISGIDQVPDSLQQDVLIFDWWVRNADRCLGEYGGNPNLFWEPGTQELVVIDHNQAFDLHANRADFSEHHVFAAQASQLSSDFCRRDEYHQRLSSTLDAWPTILSEVPDVWWFVDDEQTVPVDFDARAIEALLRGFENDEFWNWT
ncbi:MAG: HipA family kinase [Lamprobacter sp.]|uniref:HipA family kinase n=1 Tax=Lamprobacter sp. TaxID=3100796 RepID=UPI002B26095A|nr:HipA family kinase [Lamprobacter sp.]MEA3640662.1 HipA family kinase [Lamprobacter sp.]